MGTSWSEIISNHAMVYIDDIRLKEELSVSPALFLRRMSLLVSNALPMLNKPPELYCHIAYKLSEPEYDEYTWASTEESLNETTSVKTDKIGYELCSAVKRLLNDDGTVELIPVAVKYDSATGKVTIPAQDKAGEEIELDFYKDGQFYYKLSLQQKRLLGLAVAVVWDERFSRNWLNIQPKIKDQSFTVSSEGITENAAVNRLKDSRAAFFAELNKYEQDVAYKNVVLNKYSGEDLI